jgi:hypothetical protein
VRGHFLVLKSILVSMVNQDCTHRFEECNRCKIVRGIECDEVEVAQTKIKGIMDQQWSVGGLMTHPVTV